MKAKFHKCDSKDLKKWCYISEEILYVMFSGDIHVLCSFVDNENKKGYICYSIVEDFKIIKFDNQLIVCSIHASEPFSKSFTTVYPKEEL